MTFRFWFNFITVLAMLGLAIFSLIYFDKTRVEASTGDTRFFDVLVGGAKKTISFLENPKVFVANIIKTVFRTDKNSQAELRASTTPEIKDLSDNLAQTPQSMADGLKKDSDNETVNEEIGKSLSSLKEAAKDLSSADWRNQALPNKITNTWNSYVKEPNDVLGENGFFYEKTSDGHQLGWRSSNGKSYKVNLP